MRPDEFEFLLAGATLIFAFAFLRVFSIWIERERRWRVLFWLGVIAITGLMVFQLHPDVKNLRPGDFALSFIKIGGWLLPP